ncbi:MAG: AbrB/MazE/SpoVT family DNA-binding domain-containing protein [Planctomycetaceae bacterium]|nr:AbrB/MazE/SpoVT family DNA-binding domain-containing protein [Planctomycetaceae bacterium]
MIKNLTRHGNSYALVIDKPILDLLKIEPETPLEITTDGRSLTVAPASDAIFAKRFAKGRETMHRKYAKTFRRLAE